MKNKYNVKSDRYGHTHSFVRIMDTDYYRFVPEQDWMPIYVTYKEDGKNILFIDTEGGPCISENWNNGEIVVKEIIINDNLLMFKLEGDE